MVAWLMVWTYPEADPNMLLDHVGVREVLLGAGGSAARCMLLAVVWRRIVDWQTGASSMLWALFGSVGISLMVGVLVDLPLAWTGV